MIHVSAPATVRSRPGIVVHRRSGIEVTRHHGIPVTTPLWTLIDLAATVPRDELEPAINAADNRDLIALDVLRARLDDVTGHPGIGALRRVLDRRTFTLTDSALERRFLPLVRKAGLPLPKTRNYVNSFRTDFYWPQLGLVVETDSLRYHRTPAQQSRDQLRDQTHTAAGLTTLRFAHEQVVYERERVVAVLAAVRARVTPQ